MTECSHCGDEIPEITHEGEPSPILSSDSAWCSVQCWEDDHGYEWPHA